MLLAHEPLLCFLASAPCVDFPTSTIKASLYLTWFRQKYRAFIGAKYVGASATAADPK